MNTLARAMNTATAGIRRVFRRAGVPVACFLGCATLAPLIHVRAQSGSGVPPLASPPASSGGMPLPSSASARAPLVCILPGDTASSAMAAALDELRADPGLAGIDFRVFANPAQAEIGAAMIRASDVLLINTHGRAMLNAVADELPAVRAKGGRAWAIGTSFDPDFPERGLERDDELTAYFTHGGRENLKQLVRAALARTIRPELAFKPPAPIINSGFHEIESGRFFERFDDYAAAYFERQPARQGRPWVGIIFPRGSATNEQTRPHAAIAGALERRGFNPLPVFGWPSGPVIERCYFDEAGRPRIVALVALSLKSGSVPEQLAPVLGRLDVPVVNAIELYRLNRREWEASPAGLDVAERSWQVASAEFAGAIAPTVVATKERVRSGDFSFTRSEPVPERVERLADRIEKWARLRQAAPAQKRVAVIYYNYPPGRENVGASYLNVLPGSLWRILARLRADGHATDGAPASPDALFTAVRDFGSNPKAGDKDGLERIVRAGNAQLLPVSEYRAWFDQIPVSLRDAVLKKWGAPEDSRVMIWRDGAGAPFFVFPVHRWGNVLFAPQPSRGWEMDAVSSYHDLSLPPHHQYLAFYLWLQKNFEADAMVHVGTHATHEWLPGKEAGFTAADASEVMVGAVPQIYPYIVDNIGEGQQAKRRGMAAVISHMTPPFSRASLNPELRELAALVGDYHLGLGRGAVTSAETLAGITARAGRMGLLKDLSITLAENGRLDHGQLEALEHHIKDIGEKLAPFGLHTFGVAPGPAMRESTAEAILSVEPDLAAAGASGTQPPKLTPAAAGAAAPPIVPSEATCLPNRESKIENLIARIEASGPAELAALSAALAGHYIPAGPGNDPVRNPASLPTGKNFYGFDPSRLPTPAAYATGAKMAGDYIARHRARHEGAFPDRLVVNLWATETNRHEGAMEAQILALLGVRPVWSVRGTVDDVEVIPREKLGRPRVDVTVTPSGLYRDLFPSLMLLVDKAVDAVKNLPEDDNPVAKNTAAVRDELIARGIAPGEAARIAAVRIFTEPSGVYGNGVAATAVGKSGSWTNESEVAGVYLHRMSHLFGQGFWGDRPKAGDGEDLGARAFRLALKDAKGVIHSRSTNLYGTLDNDDVFQYLGGAALAVRQVGGGKTPEVLIADMTDPKSASVVTLERFMGRELRARYLNPKWIAAMLDEGYAGARFIMQVTDNLFGWQVTVPEAVGAEKWREMFEVYMRDKYGLDIRARFETAGNLRAYQAMADRMLVAIDKGYWQAAPETIAELRDASAKAARQIAAEKKTEIETRIEKLRAAAPLPDPAPAPAAAPAAPPAAPASAAAPPPPSPAVAAPSPPATQPVEGKALDEVAPPRPPAAAGHVPMRVIPGIAAALALVAFGWFRQARRL
jgi:cobaltochelatase CobN